MAFIAKKWIFLGPMVIQQSQGPLTGKTVRGKENLLIELVVSCRELGVHPREIRRRRDPTDKVISHLRRGALSDQPQMKIMRLILIGDCQEPHWQIAQGYTLRRSKKDRERLPYLRDVMEL